MTEYYTY